MNQGVIAFFSSLLNNPVFVTFIVIFAGLLVGRINFRIFSFGSSGIFIAGFAAGMMGLAASDAVTSVGLIIFMFVIGIRSGPRFFGSFGAQGLPYMAVAFSSGAAAVASSLVAGHFFGFGPETVLGVYTGSLNTTSSLAILMDGGWKGQMLPAYGIVYPLGMIIVVLFAQLAHIFMKKDLRREAVKSFNSEKGQSASMVARKFMVEKAELVGKPFSGLDFAGETGATISRIKRKGHIIIPDDTTELRLGDVVLAVGSEDALKKVRKLLGMVTHEDLHTDPYVESRQIVVTNPSLHDATLDSCGISANYRCVIVRVWRGEVELFPARDLEIELGDTLLAVGKIGDLDALEKFIGSKRRKTGEVDFFSLSFTVAAGIILGAIKLPLPWAGSFALGNIGGTLLAAMMLGYFRRIGFLSDHISHSAESLLKEIGMNLFLAGLGIKAGAGISAMDAALVIKMLAASAAVMLFTMSFTFFVCYRLLKMDFIRSVACVCGSLNNSAAISAFAGVVGSDRVTIPFAACYPLALFGIIMWSQVLAVFLR